MKNQTILVGTGPMAVEYAKVLTKLKQDFIAIGRREASAKAFEEATGHKPVTGGLNQFLEQNTISSDSSVIIATGTEGLMSTMLAVLKQGCSKVLVEKPAAISIEELLDHKPELEAYQDKVFVAYNRRFYASVIEAEQLIEEDGALQSMHFEFTEWAHKIEPLQKARGVKENWFFANSTHVVDLAFYLAGEPTSWNAFSKAGELAWHDKVNFSGAGITNKGVVFSYISNWESAGRWGIELMTPKRRIYLKPMEGLTVQLKGTIAIEEYEFDLSIDQQFKPGLYRQTEAFLNETGKGRLLTLQEHFDHSAHIYRKMLN